MAARATIIVVVAIAAVAANASVAPVVRLSSGHDMPTFGLGTWLGFSPSGSRVPVGDDDAVQKAVEHAIDVGYRHIDTAAIYSTEEQVGRGINKKIKDGVVKREDLFVTTKLWNDHHEKEQVVPALQESLKKLGLEYVDLYLIHWPVGTYANGTLDGTDYLDTWRAMLAARDQGLAKSVGVSNFNQQMLSRLDNESPEKPAVLQVEMNLNLQQPQLLAYCKDHQIAVMGYTPFGSLFPSKATPDAPPPRVDDPDLVKIAAKYNKTVPQIALRYLVELGVVPIPKSVTPSRIEQNIQVFDFELSQEDRDQLKTYDKGHRTISVKWWKDSPYYPFEKN